MTNVLTKVPMPISDPIANPRRPDYARSGRPDPIEGRVTQPWADYLNQQRDMLSTAANRIAIVTLTDQGAAIAAVDFSGGRLSGGVYRITYIARITQAASVSSSLTVTFDWTVGGLTPTFSGPAITGNTTTTIQGNEALTIRIDGTSPIRYSTAYASVGATPMKYSLDIVLEQVAA